MERFALALRRAPIRLAIVLLLSFLVAGACYGVSLSPVSQLLVGNPGGPPAGRGPAAKPSASTTAPAATTDPAASAPTDPSAGGAATAQTTPPSRPPGGGGRPASLQRGLPELGMNVGVIVVLMLIVAGVQFWLRTRRRPRTRRWAA